MINCRSYKAQCTWPEIMERLQISVDIFRPPPPPPFNIVIKMVMRCSEKRLSLMGSRIRYSDCPRQWQLLQKDVHYPFSLIMQTNKDTTLSHTSYKFMLVWMIGSQLLLSVLLPVAARDLPLTVYLWCSGRKVLGSNIYRVTDYPDKDFSWFSSVCTDQCNDRFLK